MFRLKTADESLDESPDYEAPADEAGATPESSDYNVWLQSTIFDFLDIANLPTSNERHKALVALRLGEKLADKFKLIEAYLYVQDAYAPSLELIKLYDKVTILKKQLGI